MRPTLNETVFAYVAVPFEEDLAGVEPVVTVREAEGLTLVLPESVATERGWNILFRCAWISLTFHSDLAAVGLTAAFSTALANAGISCNVVAGAFHDHLFVPWDDRHRAITALHLIGA